MAFIHMERMSSSLGITSPLNIIVPDKVEAGEKVPVLWLLHGATLNYSDWMRFTAIERHASKYQLAVVMPDGGDSGYHDMAMGGRMAYYQTYITEELPAYLRSILPLSDKREENFVAGFSMGGQGAARLSLARPELYSKAGVFSAGNYTEYRSAGAEETGSVHAHAPRYIKMFGKPTMKEVEGTPADLYFLADEVIRQNKPRTEYYMACGTEDGLYPMAVRLYEALNKKGFRCTFQNGPGAHTFEFWDCWTPAFLEWLGLAGKK